MNIFTTFTRTAIAALGALLVSTACLSAAVGPGTDFTVATQVQA